VGSNAPGAFLVFLGGHLPQTSGFRSAKEILVVFFATQPMALSCVTVTYFTLPRVRTTAGSNAPGAFFVYVRKDRKFKKPTRWNMLSSKKREIKSFICFACNFNAKP